MTFRFVLLAALSASPALAQQAGEPIALPVRYDAHRYYVLPVTERGDTLELYTDTGGGLFLLSDVVARLGLKKEIRGVRGSDTAYVVALPVFRPEASIPAPLGSPGGAIFVLDSSQRPPFAGKMAGMLGQQWFSGRVWTFDYPGRRLLLRAPGDVPRLDPRHVVPLAFKQDSTGRRVLDFPRIRVEIDGDSLDLLFDTGATVNLPGAAAATLADGAPAERATSFITTELFDRWRARHPDWRVIENADDAVAAMGMIEVPTIGIAGHRVGPVWFTQRPDRNFHQYMSQFMDRRVDGALGGSALRYFRVTVDYVGARAYFEKE